MSLSKVAFTFLGAAVASVFAAQNVIEVDDTAPGIVINKDHMMAADLAIWNPPSRYEDMTSALVDGGYNFFRFPNGSLSNDYHWNGAGSYDTDGVWVPDESKWAPGFLGETIYRGTTKDNYGFIRRSHLADNNMETIWWGEILDPMDPPWVVIEFCEKKPLDSLIIDWGDFRPKAFELSYWTEDYAQYPGVHQNLENKLKSLGVVKVTGKTSKLKFATTNARYVAVRFKTTDLPSKGVQIREMKLFSGGGDLLSGNDYKFFAMSTRKGDKARTDWTGIKWDFEVFMNYIAKIPGAKPVICVNAGTGSVKEAVAWLKYANKVKGYNIKNWQIGNELDGEWEESGPLSARQYAARYLEYARAMKAVDSTILLHGPLFSNHKMREKGAGLLDGKFWMEEFLRIVGEAEKQDGKHYLDVVDIHNYPYWEEGNPMDIYGVIEQYTSLPPDSSNPYFAEKKPFFDAEYMARQKYRDRKVKHMLDAMLDVGPNMDTMDVWMKRYLEGERQVFLSEFSSCVQGYSFLMDYPQATAVASVFAQHAMRFGNRLQVLPWDAFGNLFKGPDDTWGTISMTALLKEGSWNRWGSLEHTAEYVGVYMVFKRFLEDGYAVVPAKSPTSDVDAYAICKQDSCHILLINRSDMKQVVEIARKSGASDKVSVEVDVFGEDQFKWIGDGKDAYAYPKLGPSGYRLDYSKNKDVVIPGFGMAVVQMNPREVGGKSAAEPQVVTASLDKKVLLAGEELDLFLTATQENGKLTAGSLKIEKWGKNGKAYTQKILPDDSLWDAAIESFHVKIPVPEGTSLGERNLEVTLQGVGGKKMNYKVPFRVRGKYRTTSIMQNFDTGIDVVDWFPVVNGENATAIEGKVYNGNPPQGGYIRHDFVIEQPIGQGWPNFAGAYYVPPETVKKSVGIVFDYSTTHNNPEGYFELQVMSNQVKDYDEFMYLMKNTHGNWVRDTVIWDNITQEGWGKNIPRLDPKEIKNFAFRARHSGKGFISLDNIFLLQEDGTEVPMPKGLRRLR